MSTRLNRRAALAALTGLPFASLAAFAEEKQGSPRPGKKAQEKGWKPLWDGRTLDGWKRTEFAGGGEVRVEPSFRGEGAVILLEAGADLSGFHWTGKKPPLTDYEIALEAMKVQGNDFMLGLTFPVGESHATLVLGGWGGPVAGISSIDFSDASENSTTKYLQFVKDRWYRVRMRVTPTKLETWLDDEQIIDQNIEGRKITLRPGPITLSRPLGLATYQTTAAYRGIRMRRLKG